VYQIKWQLLLKKIHIRKILKVIFMSALSSRYRTANAVFIVIWNRSFLN